MTEEQRQKILNALNTLHDDPVLSHVRAEGLLRSALAAAGYPEIAEAYLQASERIGFCYWCLPEENGSRL